MNLNMVSFYHEIEGSVRTASLDRMSLPLDVALPGGSDGKESTCNAGDLGWEDPWRRAGQPTPVFLPGEFHGQRSLAGYSPSPWGVKSKTKSKTGLSD